MSRKHINGPEEERGVKKEYSRRSKQEGVSKKE
jgi:hypothetical protein